MLQLEPAWHEVACVCVNGASVTETFRWRRVFEHVCLNAAMCVAGWVSFFDRGLEARVSFFDRGLETRTHTPIHPSQVEQLARRKNELEALMDEGYLSPHGRPSGHRHIYAIHKRS